ncbi:MarR family winged helix-turn-helix transcriptional regulator [Amycolatopsis eburnea]|uniref:MarR family transcriptional regulator n=1 Tax=Amycolatopsis eburnea TaxID=2267691 RepID=A0A3R9F1T2_9PSEU|nr:MarR family transcriptional regulator [Amycolatopsis eburnea]RSD11693.1 MarR family transcriptional regulator [Amycolatopsis eburnea]
MNEDDTDPSATLAAGLDLAVQRFRGRLRVEGLRLPVPWTRSQLVALDRIVRGSAVTTSELAAAEHMRPQSMAQIVSALERDGLIERRPDPADARRSLIEPTGKGRDAVRTASALRNTWLADALDQELSDEERELVPKLIEVLDRLASTRTARSRPAAPWPPADR